MKLIQNKDLRIGNLINVKGFPSAIEVTSIDYEGINGFYDEGIGGTNYNEFGAKFDDNDIYGIPLQKERLINFGFTKREDFDVFTNVWERKGFIVSLGDYTNIHIDGVDEENSIKCYEELYAHELQNLYFALIGEELVWG